MSDELREQLADVQHGIWAHWMRYQFSQCRRPDLADDGSLIIPADKVQRWQRQMDTEYADLSDKERESDRHQADKVLAVVRPALAVGALRIAELERERDQLRTALAAANADRDAVLAANATLNQERRALMERAEAAEARAVTWVPVAERLPKPALRVLACYSDGRATIILRAMHMPAKTATCYEDFEDSEWDEETGNCYYPAGWYEAMESGEYAFIGPLSGTVTHWARLPHLPEVQQ